MTEFLAGAELIAHQSWASNPNVPFHLLSLPLELRSIILRYILTTDVPLIYPNLRNYGGRLLLFPQGSENDAVPYLHTNVLASCCQLHFEGAKFLYANNTFKYNNWTVGNLGEDYAARRPSTSATPMPTCYSRHIKCVHVNQIGMTDWPSVGVELCGVLHTLPAVRKIAFTFDIDAVIMLANFGLSIEHGVQVFAPLIAQEFTTHDVAVLDILEVSLSSVGDFAERSISVDSNDRDSDEDPGNAEINEEDPRNIRAVERCEEILTEGLKLAKERGSERIMS